MFDSYTHDRLVFATKRLFEDHGIVDPSIVEITLEAFNQPLPTVEPWLERDDLKVGRDIFQSVRNKVHKIRHILETEHGILTTPINVDYYDSHLRDEPPRDPGQIRASIAGFQGKTVGVRIVKPSEDDPFFLAYVSVYGARAVSGVRNAARRAGKAVELGAMDADIAAKLLDQFEVNLELPAPRAAITARRSALAAH